MRTLVLSPWILLVTVPLLCRCAGGGGAPPGAAVPASAGLDGPVDQGATAAVDARAADTFMIDLAPEPPAPRPWQSRDVGAVAVPGRTNAAAGIFFVRGTGGASDAIDAFHFLHQPIAGDGEVVAQLAEIQATSGEARAGIMIRGSLDSGAPQLALMVTMDGRGLLLKRDSAGGPIETTEVQAAVHRWLRLARAGNEIRAAVSTNRETWTELAKVEVALPAIAVLGLAVTGPAADGLATGVFHSARITAVPPPWTDSDVGDVSVPGSARIFEDRALISASGTDIGGSNDQLTYLHQPLAGDGEITVHVTGFSFADGASKLALMFRAGLGAGAPHLSLVFTPLGNLVLRRGAEGLPTAGVAGALDQLPLPWMRMVRLGAVVTSYVSADGLSWTVFHREDLAMPRPPLPPLPPLTRVGVALSAHNNSRVSVARLENLVVRLYPPYPVDGGADAPDAGATPDASVGDAP